MSPNKMTFIIPGACVPKGRPRVTFKGKKVMAYTPERTRNYANAAKAYVLNEYNKNNRAAIPYPRPVRVTLEFLLNRPPTATPDIPNLVVQMLDTLEGVSYENDSQVVALNALKRRARFPMTQVTVEEV